MAIILTAYPHSLEITQGEHVLEGGIRTYDVEYRFPEKDTAWQGMALVGVFETDLGVWSVFLDPETHTCKIPWEALDEGSAGSNLRVGLYGVREDDESFIVRSTVWAAMPFRIMPGPDAEPAQEPTPSLFQQILSAVSQVVQRMTIIQTIEKTVFNIANRVTSLHQETEYNAQMASDSASAAEASATTAQESAAESAASAAQASQTLTQTRDVLVQTEEVLSETRRVYESAEDTLEETEQVLAETKTVRDQTGEYLSTVQALHEETLSARDDAQEAELGAEAAQAGAESARDEAAEILTETRAVREGIDEALNDAEGAAQSADESARLAESWAVGGTGLRSGEDTDNAKYYAQRAKNIVGGMDIVIGDTMPSIWPVLWFDTSNVVQPSDNEMLLQLGEWTEESDIQAEVEGELYSVENAVLNGEPTEGTYSFDVL